MSKPTPFQDCPQGLEYLTQLDEVLVLEHFKLSESECHEKTLFLFYNCNKCNLNFLNPSLQSLISS